MTEMTAGMVAVDRPNARQVGRDVLPDDLLPAAAQAVASGPVDQARLRLGVPHEEAVNDDQHRIW